MDLNQIPETVGKTIEVMADKLKIPAGQLLNIVVQGTVISGIAELVISACLFASTFFIGRWVNRKIATSSEYEPWFIAHLVTGISIIAAFCTAYDGAIQAFAPAFYIIKGILKF